MNKERACANGDGVHRPVTPDVRLASEADTAILRLFRQYRAIKEAAEAHVCAATCKDDDEEMETLFWRHTDQIEDNMMALPSTCAADLAAKMIVAHCEGQFSYLSYDGPAWIEARWLTGQL